MKRNFSAAVIQIAVLLLCGCVKNDVPELAMITFITGDVTKNNAEAAIGDLIKENDVILTGIDSFCDVKLGGSLIRIKAMSNLTVSSMLINTGKENITLFLEEGKLLCKPKKMLKSEFFFVKTPGAVVAVHGTQFSVEADRLLTTRVKVFKGEVKVIKRVKQLDSDSEKLVEYAPPLKREDKTVITASEVDDAVKIVNMALKEETGKSSASEDDVIERVIKRTRDDLVIGKEKIEKFKAEDFVKESEEIIDVEEKPRDVLKRISMVIKQEKDMPVPEGRLLVTRYDVYLVKNGNVRYSGRLKGGPVRRGDRLYTASGEYVFCSMTDGPVVWKKSLVNDGNIELKEGMVIVKSNGKTVAIDESTGR